LQKGNHWVGRAKEGRWVGKKTGGKRGENARQREEKVGASGGVNKTGGKCWIWVFPRFQKGKNPKVKRLGVKGGGVGKHRTKMAMSLPPTERGDVGGGG